MESIPHKVPREIVLASLVQSLGRPKTSPSGIGEDDWKRVFDAVANMKTPRGWESAVCKWTGVSTTTMDAIAGTNTKLPSSRPTPSAAAFIRKALATRILDRAIIDNGMKPREVRATLRRITSTASGQAVGGSRGHARGFGHRNPELRNRLAELTKGPRIMGPTRKGHDQVFDNCERVGLTDKPASMVINVDESDVQSKRKTARVVGPRYTVLNRVAVPDKSVSMHISLAAAVWANGFRTASPHTFCPVREFLRSLWRTIMTTTSFARRAGAWRVTRGRRVTLTGRALLTEAKSPLLMASNRTRIT